MVAFKTDSNLPTVADITFQDIHFLAPTSQFPKLSLGIPDPSGALGAYQISFVAYPKAFLNQFTLDNVVFDDKIPGRETSLSNITAEGNDITTMTNVYPSALNDLGAEYSTKPPVPPYKSGDTTLYLNDNKYSSSTSTSSEHLAQACHRLPFTTGDLYTSKGSGATGSSTNLQSLTIPEGGSITLNAVVQPIMSQTTLFAKDSYAATPGLLAVRSPTLTNPVRFYDGWTFIGTAVLSANGTLASLVVKIFRRVSTFTERNIRRMLTTIRCRSVRLLYRHSLGVFEIHAHRSKNCERPWKENWLPACEENTFERGLAFDDYRMWKTGRGLVRDMGVCHQTKGCR